MNELLRFLKQRWQEVLITGVWLQSVVAAAFTGSLVVLGIASLGGLIALVLIFWLVGTVNARRRRAVFGNRSTFTPPRPAILFTVGFQKDTILGAIEKQRPLWLGLLCSRQTEKVADEICAGCGLAQDHIQKEIADAYDVQDLRIKTEGLLDWLEHKGVPASDTILDITAGTSVMSVGAFSLADERGVDCQYLVSETDANNKPIRGTQRGIFVIQHNPPAPAQTASTTPLAA